MHTRDDLRIEPAAEILAAARGWLAPLRVALGPDFSAAYLTGSVLSHGFDVRHSHVNILVVARVLDAAALEALARVIPRGSKPASFDPLFVTESQIRQSLDTFPIEWQEIQERHLLIDGADVFAGLEVPRAELRRQCEHELRSKHLRLRQAFLLQHERADRLTAALRLSASGIAAVLRTLLRLQGEVPPAHTGRVIERVAELFKLDAQVLLAPHTLRYGMRRPKREEIQALYRKFLVELDRLIAAVDGLNVS
jgi:hypothetical protein